MTPQSIIDDARYILQDADSAGYRQTDAELLAYVQSGIAEASVLRPDWFQSKRSMVCTVGECEQSLTFADAQAILRVVGVTGGAAMTPFDLAAMDAFNRNWKADTAGPARQWSAYPGDLLKFYIWPKAPATAQSIDVMYTRNPITLALGDTITDVPQSAQPALVMYVVAKAEMKDDESVNSGRAIAAYQNFIGLIKGTAQ
jgi:hypothetical protein